MTDLISYPERGIGVIKEINKAGATILLGALMNSDRAYVLENRVIIVEGNVEELLSNKSVKSAYLDL
jgi:ABC-type branched-subunit amino acid transport system ATPase component